MMEVKSNHIKGTNTVFRKQNSIHANIGSVLLMSSVQV